MTSLSSGPMCLNMENSSSKVKSLMNGTMPELDATSSPNSVMRDFFTVVRVTARNM